METSLKNIAIPAGVSKSPQVLPAETANASPDFDAVVIGAGFAGMHMLKSLRDKLGLKVRVYEAAETVGGTW